MARFPVLAALSASLVPALISCRLGPAVDEFAVDPFARITLELHS